MKRAASKAAGGAKMKKRCNVISHSLREAESLPVSVRKLIQGGLVHVFGTYKEERHPFQNAVSELVKKTFKTSEDNLGAAIAEANQKKAAQEAEGATVSATNDAANGASENAANVAANAKEALRNSNAALKDAKQASHDLEAAVKQGDTDSSTTGAKKEKLEALVKEFFTPVKEGTLSKGLSKSSTWVGSHLGKEFGLEKEFLTCVVRTFSKGSADWGTFDHIIEKELSQELQKITAGLGGDLDRLANAKVARAAEVETAKAAVGAAEEALKASDEANTNATAAAKDAKAAAKSTAAALTAQQNQIKKAAHVLETAEGALKTFKEGALAAYTEAEAHTAPAPAPVEEPAAEAAPAPTAEAAMAPAPAPEQRRMPSILASPSVLLQQARNLLSSPRITSPRVAQS